MLAPATMTFAKVILAVHISRLVELSRRDLEARGPGGPSGAATATFSPEYQATQRQTLLGAVVIALLVLITVAFMALRTGA